MGLDVNTHPSLAKSVLITTEGSLKDIVNALIAKRFSRVTKLIPVVVDIV